MMLQKLKALLLNLNSASKEDTHIPPLFHSVVMHPRPDRIYDKLRGRFGFLNWWPGDTHFEIFVGAVLTQQTTWKNVEKAIANIKRAGRMDLDSISRMHLRNLEAMVKPSGYYRQKARRLHDICSIIKREYGSIDGLFKLGSAELRARLLSMKGIGEETADSIALYAAGKPTFVVDAYTRRIMHRIDHKISEKISYGDLKLMFESNLKPDLTLYKDFHAQFVELGKNICKKRDPLCGGCPLKSVCETGASRTGDIKWHGGV